MQLQEVVYSQGFGTRRICAGLIQQGYVEIFCPHGGVGAPGASWQRCTEPAFELAESISQLRVQGQIWEIHSLAHVMLHKPAGTECSHKPSMYPSVYSLLPAPLRRRPARTGLDGVQAIGRLDQDTTGLLLFSDDGAFIHRMASPKKHVPKTYEVTTRHPVGAVAIQALLQGVVLDDDPRPVRAEGCTISGTSSTELVESCHIRLTLTQGKFHQVKRMIAAIGNRVEVLHRSRIGALDLPSDLAPGHWRWLSSADLLKLQPAAST